MNSSTRVLCPCLSFRVKSANAKLIFTIRAQETLATAGAGRDLPISGFFETPNICSVKKTESKERVNNRPTTVWIHVHESRSDLVLNRLGNLVRRTYDSRFIVVNSRSRSYCDIIIVRHVLYAP